MNETQWEAVRVERRGTYADELERLRIEGGWLYRQTIGNGPDQPTSVALAFVPLLTIGYREK